MMIFLIHKNSIFSLAEGDHRGDVYSMAFWLLHLISSPIRYKVFPQQWRLFRGLRSSIIKALGKLNNPPDTDAVAVSSSPAHAVCMWEHIAATCWWVSVAQSQFPPWLPTMVYSKYSRVLCKIPLKYIRMVTRVYRSCQLFLNVLDI